MDASQTCWTVIRSAADGDVAAREKFARCYEPVVRRFLRARWSGTPCEMQLEDAVQETFLECFRGKGVLDQVAQSQPQGFQRYLRGVVRNVALRQEHSLKQRSPALASTSQLDIIEADEERLSQVFDRAWAQALLVEAVRCHRERAATRGADGVRRADLLRERFYEQRPIRQIALRWGVDAATLHREYRKGREEFRDALLTVIRFHHPDQLRSAEVELQHIRALLDSGG